MICSVEAEEQVAARARKGVENGERHAIYGRP